MRGKGSRYPDISVGNPVSHIIKLRALQTCVFFPALKVSQHTHTHCVANATACSWGAREFELCNQNDGNDRIFVRRRHRYETMCCSLYSQSRFEKRALGPVNLGNHSNTTSHTKCIDLNSPSCKLDGIVLSSKS